MNKKIIAVALLILMISVVFISCGKKRSWEKDDTTAAPSETTSIEYTTDESGEKFITNINGELIPVTTGKDGSVEFYEDLITKPTEPATTPTTADSNWDPSKNAVIDWGGGTTKKN